MNANALATLDHSPPESPELEDDGKIVSFPSASSATALKKTFTHELTLHHRDLLVYARSIVFDADQARDLVQEACLTAWGKFQSFDPEQADFGTWMRGVLRNKVRDWVKSKKGGSRPEVSLDESHLDFLDAEFSQTQKVPTFRRLKNCLKKLPDNLLTPIQLTYYSGHNGDEASQELGIQPATLRKRLSRGRQLLHACMNQTPDNTPTVTP